MVIPPSQGYVIFTRETWGCIAEQKIVEDATAALAHRDGNAVRIEETKSHEDVQNRKELYAYFPAREVNRLEGFYVLRAHIQHQDPKIIGELVIDQARLMHVGGEWFVELFSRTTGTLQISLLYGRHVGLSSGYLACPEAGQFEPRARSFIRAYRVESLLTVTSEPSDGRMDKSRCSHEKPGFCRKPRRWIGARNFWSGWRNGFRLREILPL